MAPKKKKEGKKKPGKKQDKETDAEREARLHRDHDTLTETLNNLKQRAAQLRRENAILQEEADQIRLDNQEYVSYMTKRAQKRQNVMDALNNQTQQKLEELSKQSEEMAKKHKERLNGLKKKTMEKENDMAPLQRELADLGDLASVRQKQLDRITELEQKVSAARSRHLQVFHDLTEKSDKKLKRFKAETQRRMMEHLAMTSQETTVSHKLSEENRYLNAELHQLIRRAQALRNHKEHLEMQRLQLLEEKELYASLAASSERNGELARE